MAIIKEYCIIGDEIDLKDVTVWPFSNITGDVFIDDGTCVGSHSTILGVGMSVTIGKNVRIQSYCFIPGGTIIGDNVFIGPNVTFLNDKYPMSSIEEWQPVTVKEGAIIGGGCILCPGVIIGKNAKVGAGSVVIKDVADGGIVAGHLARDIISKWQSK